MDKERKKEELKKIVRSRIKGLGLDALFHQVDISKKDESSSKKDAVSEEEKKLLARLREIKFLHKRKLQPFIIIKKIKDYLTSPYSHKLIIDIGESSIKAIKTSEIKNKIVITNIFYKTIPYLLRENLTKKEEFVQATLEDIISSSDYNKFIISVISNAKVILRFLNFPTINDKEIKKMLELEIKEHLPLSPEEMEIDWQVIKKEKGKSKVILAAIKKEEINQHLKFLEKLKIAPSRIEVHSLVLHNSLPRDEEKDILQVNIGDKNTDINIIKRGELVLSRCLEWGSKDLTSLIAESLNLSFDNAEKIKKENGIILSKKERNPTSKIICDNACKWTDYLIEEIKKSLTYLQAKKNVSLDIDKLLLSGGGANLINISDYLKENLKMKVGFPKSPQYIEISSYQDTYRKYFLELVSLTGALFDKKEKQSIKINLLPGELKSSFRIERIRNKLVLSVCVLLGIVFSLLIGTSMILNKKSDKITKQKQKIEILSSEVKSIHNLKERIRNIQAYISLKKSCMEALRGISLIVTPDITINKFIFEKDRIVLLEGEASSHSSVVNFSKNLSDSPLFESVQIKYTKRKERLKEEVIFEIICALR